jgi:acetyl esterase/lipase
MHRLGLRTIGGLTPEAVLPSRPLRRRRRLVVLTVVLVVVALAAGAWAMFNWVNEPEQPSAFYTPPEELPAGPRGTIIRTEELEKDVPEGARGWRVLYLSTGPDGQPLAVSGRIYAPAAPAQPGTRKVVAWAHGTTGIVDACAPSIEAPSSDIPSLAELLAAGHVVTATDYPGLGTPGTHPYLVGTSEGRAVLDSVRAAELLPETGAGSDFVVWGHSQGGHATLFSGLLQPTYAPELRLAGLATAAPATELGELFKRDIGETTGKVLISMAVVAWDDVYPGTSLDQVLEPVAIPLAKAIAGRCILTNNQALLDAPDVAELSLGFDKVDPTTVEPWTSIFAENTPAAGPFAVPVFVAQGTADNVVWPDVTEGYVTAACAAGADVELRTYPDIDHFGVRTASAADTVAWIEARFAGTPPASTCT